MASNVHILSACFESQVVIRKQLVRTKHPVAREEHDEGSHLQVRNYILGKLLVVHRRDLVGIVKHILLRDVQYH